MSIWGRRDSEPPAEETQESQAEASQSQAETRESQAEAQDTQEPAAEHQAGEPAPAFWRAQGETPASLGRDPADAPPPDSEHVPENPPPAGVPATMGPTPAYGQQAPEATGVQEPTVAVAREPVVTEAQEPKATGVQQPAMVPEPAATETEQPTVATITAQRWSEILVAFVDDPRGSVKMAADAVDEAFGEFVKEARLRQRDLASTWQSAEADTEQLRTALQDYRKLGHRVQQLDLGEKTGA